MTDDEGIDSDQRKRDVLREVADDLREQDGSDEAERIAAVVHRVSDIYDDSEETDAQHVYLNMRNILQISEQGGIER